MFRELESLLPAQSWFGKIRKPNKADILRNAMTYMQNLCNVINDIEPTTLKLRKFQEKTTLQTSTINVNCFNQSECVLLNTQQSSNVEVFANCKTHIRPPEFLPHTCQNSMLVNAENMEATNQLNYSSVSLEPNGQFYF